MKIQSVQIKNYRSIEDLTLNFLSLKDGSLTYGLIGLNEAGKSSILKALALKDALIEVNTRDFRGNKPIEIIYILCPNENEIENYGKIASGEELSTEVKGVSFEQITCKVSFDKSSPGTRNFAIDISDQKTEVIEKLEEKLKFKIVEEIPNSIFWTAQDRYLIDKPINQSEFAASPDSVSIPLKNCFLLAGIQNISQHITSLTETTEVEELQNLLSEKVTEHIKTAWPNHPIQITFYISNNLINFHVKDLETKGKAKTADQRSDGFKQFVSFLLTISAQSKNQELTNSVLLLDEPETHLHPQAQEYLLSELIKITANDKNNICLFATHSLFMIDKADLGRNLKVSKSSDKTAAESFANKVSSYSKVAFEVYDISTTDLHNELYGMLQAREDIYTEKEFDNYLGSKGLKGDLPYIKIKKDQTTETYNVTLPVKIRNIIHHPENKNNSFSQQELRNSIIDLLKLCVI